MRYIQSSQSMSFLCTRPSVRVAAHRIALEGQRGLVRLVAGFTCLGLENGT